MAGGSGTRLRPLTHAMPKQLVPVANQPILHHVLNSIAAANIQDIGIITNPETAPQIEASVRAWQAQPEQSHPNKRPECVFIAQAKPLGLAHAVQCAQAFLGNAPFVMYLGDNLINVDLDALLKAFLAAPEQAASLLLKHVEHPQQFGVAVLDDAGRVKQLIEKPKLPPSHLALVGVYLFRPAIFNAIAQIQPSARGELEITDAIQKLIDLQHAVHAYIHPGWWLDTGKKDDLLQASQVVLSELTPKALPDDLSQTQSTLSGVIHLGRQCILNHCTITGPVLIADHCTLNHVTIGPNTSIGHHAQLSHCTLQESVLLDHCQINGWPARITHSLIGENVLLNGNAGVNITGNALGEQQLVLANDSRLDWQV
ncbi:MAG: glucose-1-phosphate thymidylyltransferase [Vampirovibrionales bacterium]|nr:glucose-1-phosphate thymidylyltransferase [Vampirovibrionales bacterium]